MERSNEPPRATDRRSFLLKGAALGAGAFGVTRGLARPTRASADAGLTDGDVAILKQIRHGRSRPLPLTELRRRHETALAAAA